MQRYLAPLTPAAPSTTTVFCSPPRPEMFPWALRLQTTSPSETLGSFKVTIDFTIVMFILILTNFQWCY